ncbi:hypothetical protein [Bremerella cremea]|uniref:hypothetical protein n=1 Tax=Bremerella cremea TaxID=1031537 RepID=UPI0031EF7973
MNEINPFHSPTSDTSPQLVEGIAPSPTRKLPAIAITLLGLSGMIIGRLQLIPTLFGFYTLLSLLFDVTLLHASFAALILPGTIACWQELREKFRGGYLFVLLLGMIGCLYWLIFMGGFVYGFIQGFTKAWYANF